jgi:accessory gene regulator protein AgrB
MYAPVEHPNRPLKNNEPQKFKITALTILTILFFITLYTNNNIVTNSITIGISLAGLITTPIICKLK